MKGSSMNDQPFFETGNGCRIAYRLDRLEAKPVLVLSNSIGITVAGVSRAPIGRDGIGLDLHSR